ncbi:MAG: YARHG domain-containing protein [Treponema sp.]|nr:YARHG domain-containing protein [Treponema sp.]
MDIDCSSKKTYKYLKKCENADVYYGDFTFDDFPDISWIKLRQGPVFELHKLDLELNTKYLEVLYPPAVYYLKTNPRISQSNYISFDDLQFCIVNGKRGIRIFSIGEIQHNKKNKIEYYEAILENSTNSIYYFFYWDKNEQRYILDESVTQEDLANAYCPEDYFAYNGLQFSKLDSKLTDSDLKDLDKAQLRLMRNAVYARHGRTFKSVDLQSLWECYTWYKKNPDYSDALLTETDKYNIELIQKYEVKVQ